MICRADKRQCNTHFQCSVKVCEMDLNNEDNLNWHQKKQDKLNLGLECTKPNETGSSIQADQTPTPTRFIRNCEEVGLFQDLQNVNPFDEVFKNAVEGTTKGALEVPQNENDDTLHTPEIYPHIEKFQQLNTTESPQTLASANFLPLNTDISSPISIKSDSDIPNLEIKQENEKTEENPNKELKKRIRKSIQTKSHNIINTSPSTSQTVKVVNNIYSIKVPISRLPPKHVLPNKTFNQIDLSVLERAMTTQTLSNSRNSPHDTSQKKKKASKKELLSDEAARVREINRAAQYRCRAKKQKFYRELESEVVTLRTENKRLNNVNMVLTARVKELEARLAKPTKADEDLSKNSMTTSSQSSIYSTQSTVQSSRQSPINLGGSPVKIRKSSSPNILTKNTKTNVTKPLNITSTNMTTNIQNNIVVTIPPGGNVIDNVSNTNNTPGSVVQSFQNTSDQAIYVVTNPSSTAPLVLLKVENLADPNVNLPNS